MVKKALVITEVFHPEDFIINDLVDNWIGKGYDLEVLTRNPSYPYGKILKGYKNKFYCKSNYKGSIIHRFLFIPGYQNSLLLKLLNYINYMFFSFWVLLFIGKRFNKVFIYQTGPLTNAFTAVLLKPFFKYKITIWSQDLWPDTVYAYGLKKKKITNYILLNIVRFIYTGCDTILISCSGFKSKIENMLRKPKTIHWVPNWPLVNGFSEKKEELSNGFNFTFAGNIGKVQNLDNVVRAFKTVSEKHPTAFLNIVGDGSFLELLKRICIDEKITNVNFTGRKPVNKMPNFFAASDVLLISLIDVDLYDIMIPSKFQTYLTAKKPIFAIMKGEVADLVSQYNIGMSAHPASIEAIEAGFIKFLNLPSDKIDVFSENSSVLLQASFNEFKIKKKLQKLFWYD